MQGVYIKLNNADKWGEGLVHDILLMRQSIVRVT